MADDTNFRSYRPADQRWPAKTPAARDSGHDRNDPLAELARLIGQTDPFGDLNKVSPPRGAPAGRPVAPAMPPAPTLQPPAPSTFSADPYGSPLQFGGKGFDAPGFAPSRQDSFHPAQDSFQPAYDPAIYGTPQQQAPEHPSEAYYEDGARLPQGELSYEEDYGEDRPRRWPRYAFAAVAVLVLGTSGVFGYKALFGTSSFNGTPPVIKASTTPSKVAATPSATGKQINDRVGDASQGERIVSREEKPLDMKEASRQIPPARTVFPNLPGMPGNAVPDSLTATASPPVNANAGGPSPGGPKVVKTLPIRPDQAGAEPPAPRPAAATAPAARSNAPVPLTPNAVPARQAAPQGNAPLSLSPQVANAEASAQRAAFPPVQPTPAAAPARVASIPPAASEASTGGGYTVQISSQRSEAEAQTSFRSLQGKFPSLLGSRSPIIRRADLGEKGVFFRTMVGGFASLDQAKQFCGSLKSAGAQCVVPIN